MLLEIREKMKSWVAWVIVGLISLPFALFGINSYFNGTSEVVVAEVNGTEISLRNYQNAMTGYKRRLRSVLKENYSADMAETPFAKRAVLDDLVEQELVGEYVDSAGYGVSDQQLLKQIEVMPEFQKNNKFDKATYKRVVNSQRMTEEQFEARLRQDMMEQQFRSNINATGLITKATLDEIGKLQNQIRTARFLMLTANDVEVNKKLTPEDRQSHYEKTKANYVIPEAVKVQYVRLSADDLGKDLVIDDEKVQALYTQQKLQHKTDELRDVSHIMIVVPKEEDDDKALARISKVKAEIDAGKDFATLAKEHSEDLGSALKGGSLGYTAKSVLDPALAKVVFAMKVDEISKPVRTKFGYHIAKLNKIKASKIKPLAEVKGKLVQEEQARQAQELFFDKAEQFSNLAYEEPDNLSVLKDTLQLTLHESDWVTNTGGKDLFANSSVVRELFSDEVLKDGQNTSVIELSDEDYVVLRILEHREQAYKPLDSVVSSIEKDILAARTEEALQKKGDSMLAELQKDESSVTGTWDEAKPYTGQSELAEQLKIVLFSMGVPKDSKPSYQGTKNEDGFTIIALDKVSDGKAITEKDKEALQSRLSQILGERESKNFIASLRDNDKVKVFYDQVLDEQ